MIDLPSRKLVCANPNGPEDLVDRAVGVEQALPGVDPHQVADPERRHQQDQDQALVLRGEPRGVVGDGVAEHEADDARRDHVLERADQGRLVDVRAGVELLEGAVERVERPPPRRVVRHRRAEVAEVHGAERDREHHVERQDEQEDRAQIAPGATNDGQYHLGYQTPDRSFDAPATAAAPSAPPRLRCFLRLGRWPLSRSLSQAPALISVHASSHIWSTSGGSSYGVRSFLNMSSVTTAEASVSGTTPFCDQRVRVDRRERRLVAVPVDEVLVAVLLVEHEVDELVREARVLRGRGDDEQVVADHRLAVVGLPVAEHVVPTPLAAGTTARRRCRPTRPRRPCSRPPGAWRRRR